MCYLASDHGIRGLMPFEVSVWLLMDLPNLTT